jgi:hypothetical protein
LIYIYDLKEFVKSACATSSPLAGFVSPVFLYNGPFFQKRMGLTLIKFSLRQVAHSAASLVSRGFPMDGQTQSAGAGTASHRC